MALSMTDSTTTVFDINTTEIDVNTTTNDTGGGARPPMPSLDVILNLYVEYRWSRYIGIYGYPILALIGTLGNIISFIVMTRRTMRRSSTCYYMSVLAVADTLVLIFGTMRKWFSYLMGYDAVILSPAACKIFNFLTFWSFDFAAWILVAMTIERFITIHFPLTVPKYATIQRARKVSLFLGVVFALINMHFFFTVTISDKGFCTSLDEYFDFNEKVFPWIDAALYSFIPFIVLLVFNILIIIDVRVAVKRRKGLHASTVNPMTTINMPSNWRLTAMLLSVSLTFLVASAPKAVLIIIEPSTFDFFDGPFVDFHLLAKYTLTASVMNFLTYGNHAINLLLYCVTGKKFRVELRRLLYFCIHRKHRLRVASIQVENGDAFRRNSLTEIESANSIPQINIAQDEMELSPLPSSVIYVQPNT